MPPAKGTLMQNIRKILVNSTAAAIVATLLSTIPTMANAHCDTLDGPVITDAKAALAKKDVTPILKWIPEADEAEIKSVFQHTLKLSAKGEDVKEMAETYFFETLVRIHRAGEGFAYTGLKATAKNAGPAVLGADQSLETGNVGNLANMVANEVAEGIRKRFQKTHQLKQKADKSVKAGREYVAAYVDYVHFVEEMHAITAGPVHGEHEKSENHDKSENHEKNKKHEKHEKH